MPTNKLKSSDIEKAFPAFPNEDLSKIFFHSIMSELSELQEEIGYYSSKEIIFRSLNRIPSVKIEWGDQRIYGRNRVLMAYKDKIAVLDLTPVIQALKLVWNTYITSQNLKK